MYPLMNPDPEMASPYPQPFECSPISNISILASDSSNYHSSCNVNPRPMETGNYRHFSDSFGLISSSLSSLSSSSTPSSPLPFSSPHLSIPITNSTLISVPSSSLSSPSLSLSSSSSSLSSSLSPAAADSLNYDHVYRTSYCKREKSPGERLILVRQPASNHRARYKTEGSRGAVKDRTGKGFPVIRLEGYTGFKSIKLVCFIGDENKLGEPHTIYKVSKVTSRAATPCNCRSVNGVKALEFELSPNNGMELEINCIGILKERMFEVKKRFNLIFTKSHSCRLVFACIIPETGSLLKLVSDPIVCVQTLGSPEIHMTSTRKTTLNGGKEVIILGRNFTRDAIINLETNGNNLQVLPLQEYINSAHLVFRSPSMVKLANYLKTDSLEVELKVICGDKVSDPIKLHYQRPSLLESTLNFHD